VSRGRAVEALTDVGPGSHGEQWRAAGLRLEAGQRRGAGFGAHPAAQHQEAAPGGGMRVSSGFMPVVWSGLSPEVLLALDRRAGEPLRSQLEGQLREAIRSGRLGVGERLPSSRELARELHLSRGLVQDCYAQLQAEGYLSTRVGSATRVAAGAGTPPAAAPAPSVARQRVIADFLAGVPDLASFPRGDWLWALREASRAAPTAAFGYGDPRGSPVLREVLAAYLRRVRAAAADPERMVICTGFAQGLGLALRALARAGLRKVAFEDPGYADTRTSPPGRE
jgi:GntR family transcriptional regulator/MocR family aminotransferase